VRANALTENSFFVASEAILNSVKRAWSEERASGKRALDLSSGGGDTARMIASMGFRVTGTDYGSPPEIPGGINWVAGVDLNEFLPFKTAVFDAVNLIEVIEHIEHQAQLIREIGRVLKPGGVIVISTPNILNVFSRVRFLFTGFLRGRVRPAHFSRKPRQAPNIYLLHFYELYYLLFHYGFEIVQLYKTRIKFAPVLFATLLYPFMWLFSLITIIHAEKDHMQRRYNRQILKFLFSPALLLSDNIVVRARKL
jgi:SAM-dependent methyltransferase